MRSLSALSSVLKQHLSVNSKGSLNWEWVVCPAGRSRDAMPDEATAKMIFPWDQSELIIVFKGMFSQYQRDRKRTGVPVDWL
ncbi:hypothetical protein Tco_0354897 [Tanacetum coccineum]